MSRSPTIRAGEAAVALLLALGGCKSAASSGIVAPDTLASAPSQSSGGAVPQSQTAQAPKPGATTPVSSAPGSTTAALVTGVSTATYPGYDRFVIDLSGPIPGYQVSYVNSLVFDASGAAVPLTGRAYLRIRLAPANAHDLASGQAYFPGGAVAHPGFPTLTGYAATGDFEAVVSFGLALSHRAGFHVSTLTGPSRIVVDLAH